MPAPLVSVICLCYNHGRFVKEAILSVLRQSYDRIEIIVVDDASSDNSVDEIKDVLKDHPGILFMQMPENAGNCRAFNAGWKAAHGEYIVDFATDDVLMPDRIEKQIVFFQQNPECDVVFTDAVYIDEAGSVLREHYAYLRAKRLLTSIPEGDIYADVLETYFICAPTMLVRSNVFKELGGYDEALAYEDFDFWVRSSRNFQYRFLNEKLTKVRISSASLSKAAYRSGDRQVHSTYLVCRKAKALNRTNREVAALQKRLRFEIRQCVFSENRDAARLFYALLLELGKPGLSTRIMMTLNKLKLPLTPLRRWYHTVRYS